MSVRPAALAPLLAALAAIGPFSIDTYLPAMPAIAASLGATQLQVQQTLTAFLAPFAVMTLWHGALSDGFGRRRVILATMLLFAAASAVCMLAPRIEVLWLGRALQGMTAGAGTVVGRAVIRDMLAGAAAQRLMAHVTVMFALAPAVAPILGGWIFVELGWRAVFGFLTLLGVALWLLCLALLPETLAPEHRQSVHPVFLLRSYRAVFSRGEFLQLAGTLALNFAGFFVYVLAAPVFLMEHLGVGPNGFAWMFVPSVTGLMIGSALSGRMAGRITPRRTAAIGFSIMALAAAANLTLNLATTPGVPWAILPVAAYNVGMALSLPSLTLMVLDLFPRQRGLVSSCQSFTQGITNSLTAAVVAPLAWASPLAMALAMGGFLGTGMVLFAVFRHRHPDSGWRID